MASWSDGSRSWFGSRAGSRRTLGMPLEGGGSAPTRYAVPHGVPRVLVPSLVHSRNCRLGCSYTACVHSSIPNLVPPLPQYKAFGNWPPQLYVRISNRLRGQVLLTQNTIANPRSKPDGVSMGCWEFDQHTVSRHAVLDPSGTTLIARNEGYMRAELTWPHRPCRVCAPWVHFGGPGRGGVCTAHP